MLLITSLSKFIVFLILMATLSFSKTSSQANNEYNTTRDIKIMKFTLNKIKKSYLELEKKYDECENKRKSNIITDFDFSKSVLDSPYLDSWIISYDLANAFQCTNKAENKVIRYVLGFNEMKKYYKQEKVKISDEILMSLNMEGVSILEYDKSLIPMKAKEYLDKKLNKLFYGRKLRDAYKAYLEKQKKE